MNLTPWSGSNFRAAVRSPTFPSPIKSVSGRPRFWYFLATEMTKRRLRFTSSCIASWFPARTSFAMAISCCGVSSADWLTSNRYWSRMSLSASYTPRVFAVSRLRLRAFLGGELARIFWTSDRYTGFSGAGSFVALLLDFAVRGAGGFRLVIAILIVRRVSVLRQEMLDSPQRRNYLAVLARPGSWARNGRANIMGA